MHKFKGLILLCNFIVICGFSQYVPHHKNIELVTNGGFETGGPYGGYLLNESSGCDSPDEGSKYRFIHNGDKCSRILNELLTNENIYILTFSSRRGLNETGNSQFLWQCNNDYMSKGEFEIILSESLDANGNPTGTKYSLGNHSANSRSYWDHHKISFTPEGIGYKFITFKSKSNSNWSDLFRNGVCIDNVSIQECGVQTCSRTAGKIIAPNVLEENLKINQDAYLKIDNNLDNVSKLTIQYGGYKKVIVNPNGIKYFEMNGTETKFASGDNILKITLENDCDKLEVNYKICYCCPYNKAPIKNNDFPNAPNIPRYQCADYLTVTSDFLPFDTKFGSRTELNTSGIIFSNSQLTFKAGKRILLMPGFMSTGLFNAQIEPVFGLKSNVEENEVNSELEDDFFDENVWKLEKKQKLSNLLLNEKNSNEIELKDTKNQSSENSYIKIYPNPTKNIVYLDFPDSENCFIEVYSSIGKLIFTSMDNTKIDLSNYSPGQYILKIKTSQSIQIVKVIKTL